MIMFAKTYILALDKREKDTGGIKEQLDKIHWKATRLLVGDGKTSKNKYWRIDTPKPSEWKGNDQTYNYAQCWKKLIEEVKQKKISNFLFFEDDAQLLEKFFSNLTECLSTFTLKFGDAWDMFYLGSNQLKEDSLWGYKGLKTHFVCDGVLRSARARDMHAVAVNHTMYDALLALFDEKWLPSNPSFDEAVAHALHHKHKVYACKPSLVIQKPGFSYNKGKYDNRISTW